VNGKLASISRISFPLNPFVHVILICFCFTKISNLPHFKKNSLAFTTDYYDFALNSDDFVFFFTLFIISQ
jgi:hypothetical protein